MLCISDDGLSVVHVAERTYRRGTSMQGRVKYQRSFCQTARKGPHWYWSKLPDDGDYSA